jgi:tRNA-2-methylthio-N6-dimethylallyladenosine synthase
MQGCNNYCAYCVVPFLRGREKSRPLAEIVAEIEALVETGVKEVTLLGQNVNSYGQTLSTQSSFPELLRAIGTIEGLKRVRFTTSHPKDLSDDLIDCFGTLPVLCEHIHLPVQSGSDRVLALMNRGYSRTDYLRKVEKLREACPDIALSSDIIVGFPGEGEEDFRQTLDLIDKIGFDNLFSFKYSRREGTAALSFPDQVSDQEKKERLQRLQTRQEVHTLSNNRKQEGSLVEVLVEGRSRNGSEDMMGRTRTNRIVNFRGGVELIGSMVSVRVLKAYMHSLRGELQG